MNINKNLSFAFQFIVVLLLIFILVSFGVLIGSVSLSDLSVGVKWTDIVSVLSSIISTVTTLFGISVAYYVGLQWRKQDKDKDLCAYSDSLILFQSSISDLKLFFVDLVTNSYPNDYVLSDEEKIEAKNIVDELDDLSNKLLISYSRLLLRYDESEVKSLSPSHYRNEFRQLKNTLLKKPTSFSSLEDYENEVRVNYDKFGLVIENKLLHVKSLLN